MYKFYSLQDRSASQYNKKNCTYGKSVYHKLEGCVSVRAYVNKEEKTTAH